MPSVNLTNVIWAMISDKVCWPNRYPDLSAGSHRRRGRQDHVRLVGFHAAVWNGHIVILWVVSRCLLHRFCLLIIPISYAVAHTVSCFICSLTYTPCADCAGVEYINITMYENQTDPEIPPANSTDVIIVNIQSINDPPIPVAAYNGKLLLKQDVTEPIVVCTCILCSLIIKGRLGKHLRYKFNPCPV